MNGIVACDVGGDASGFVDDGGDGGDVPEGDGWFDDGVYSAGGEEDDAVAVGEASCVFGGGVDLFVEGAELWGGEVGEGGGVDEGATELIDFAHSCGDGWVVVGLVEAAEACSCVDEFVEAGHGDGAEDGGAVVEKGKHGAEEGDALDEGDGAVDGIDDPLVFVAAGFVGELFAEDPVVWEVVFDSVTELRFDGLIGDGDGGAIGFVVGGEGALTEPLEGEFGAGHGVGGGEGEAGLEFLCHMCGIIVNPGAFGGYRGWWGGEWLDCAAT